MTDVASSSVQPPDVARLELGAPFSDSLVPRKVILPENGGVETPLWPPGASPGAMRLAVLGWLGRNSEHPLAQRLSAASVHVVFTLPEEKHFKLLKAPGIMPRRERSKAGKYCAVDLGSVGGDGLPRRRVRADAHHLVCSLIHGALADPTWVAQHRCHQKTCVNPRCLVWDTQGVNVRTSVAASAASKTVRRGATVCMTGFWCCGSMSQGRCRVIFMHADGL